MKSQLATLKSLSSAFSSDFHKRVILEGMIHNCQFWTDKNNAAHIEALTKFHLHAEQAKTDDDALVRVEQDGQFLEILEAQAADVKRYMADLLTTYQIVVGTAYVPREKAPKKTASTKNTSKYLKKYAQV